MTQPYFDYVVLESELVNSPEGERLRTYWQQQLAGELPVLELPTYKPRPPIRTYNGDSYAFQINNKLTTRLRLLAETENVMLYDILLAAFEVILHRYTGEEDILIACPIRHQSFEGVVGNFDNPVVFRLPISGSLAFKEFLNQVSKKVSENSENGDYPFPLLVKEFQSKSNFSHSPICQVSFSMHEWQLSGMDWEYLELPREKVEWDLSLEISELREEEEEVELKGCLKYNSDVLDAFTVEQIGGHYQNLLEAIVENSEQEMGELAILSDRDRHQLLIDWNYTDRDYDYSSIQQLFEEQVERTPDAIAVVFEEQQLTYRELNERANQLAHYLQRLGVKPEVLVGLCVERCLDMVVGLLGILKAGGAYVPLDPGYPQERLAYMLEDSQVRVLLYGRGSPAPTQKLAAKLPEQLPEHRARVVCLDKDWGKIQRENKDNPVSGVTPDNLAYVIYTSGSTGKPKGVQICHRSLTNFLNSMRQTPGMTNSDTLLAVTTISFDIAALEIYLPLIVGAKIILASSTVCADGVQLLEMLVNSGVTVMQATPATWRMLLAAGWEGTPELKILCGGEALPRELSSRLLERSASLWNMYGPTETTIWSTIYNVTAASQDSDCRKDASEYIGKPIANTQIYILDRYLQPVPIGVPGELHIGGIGLAKGYLNRPDLTGEKFIDNSFGGDRLYKTGDLARYLPDGNIEYMGRIDNQVKIRGFRIELGEIENALASHPDVLQAVAQASTTKSGEKQLVAYVVPKVELPLPVGAGLTGDDIKSFPLPITPNPPLRSFLKEKLPDYMVPAAIVVLESFPLTPNGKINRRALPAPDAASFVGASFVPPRDRIESQLAQIWSEILNIHPVGVKDNFFDLGGHSILAVHLMGKIKQQFGKNLPLTALFPSATIEELAARMGTQTEATTHPCIVPIQPSGTKLPFFCVHPALGQVLCYANLSRNLGNTQPFYGLRAIGFDEGEKPLDKVEDMASLYIKAMQTVQPEGPYQVGGWSFGGVVAFEIAQQLQKMGQEVSLLALLDSYVPIILDKNKKIDDVYLVGVLSRLFGGMCGQDNLVTPEELENLSISDQLEYITDKAKKAKIFPQEVSGQDNRRIVEVLVGTLKATYAYQRQPYPGKVTVFRAQEKHIMAPDPTLVWVELFAVLAAKEIEIIKVPGSHYTFVLEPNLPVLAERLRACL